MYRMYIGPLWRSRAPARDQPPIAVSLALVLLVVLCWDKRQTPAASAAGADVPVPAGARYSGDLTRLFTPPHVEEGTYRVYVTPASVRTVAAFYRQQAGAATDADSWRVGSSDPMEALGTSGPYDHFRVARLYTGTPVSLARGSIKVQDRVAWSVTLIAPHPNATLSALEPSTMVILFRVPAGDRR